MPPGTQWAQPGSLPAPNPGVGTGTDQAAAQPGAGQRDPSNWVTELQQRATAPGFQPLPKQVEHQLDGALEETDPTHPFDGTFYDEYRLLVPAGSPVRAHLKSEAFDPYLYMFFATADGEVDDDRVPVQNDDNVEGTYDAFVEAPAVASDSIVIVWANSVSPGEVGDYELRVSLAD